MFVSEIGSKTGTKDKLDRQEREREMQTDRQKDLTDTKTDRLKRS